MPSNSNRGSVPNGCASSLVIGDILDKSLRELAAKKIKQRLTFSEGDLREIAAMHQRLLDNLHLATSVFMMGDIRAGRSLLAEKDRMRDQEQAATDNHLRRLREGRLQSIETSSLHIDIARDLKRIAPISRRSPTPSSSRAAPCAAPVFWTRPRAGWPLATESRARSVSE